MSKKIIVEVEGDDAELLVDKHLFQTLGFVFSVIHVSLSVQGFLSDDGSLSFLGFLYVFGSLRPIGFLSFNGSLLRSGFLFHDGSLESCGFL